MMHCNHQARFLTEHDADSGAMGSYAAFYLAGLYPLPATSQFLLGSPYFPQISFRNPTLGTTTTIKTKNFNGNPADGKTGNIYVKVCYYLTSRHTSANACPVLQSVTIDGKPWKSNCYLEWSSFQKGSTIELELTNNPNVTCGNGAAALPASLSTGGYN